MDTNPVQQTLIDARALIVKGWTRFENARDRSGRGCYAGLPQACRFCAGGAIHHVIYADKRWDNENKARIALNPFMGYGIEHFNDESKSKHRVLKAFDQAIEAAK